MATSGSYIDAAILVQLDAKLLVIAYWKETFLLNDVLLKKKHSFAIYSKALFQR